MKINVIQDSLFYNISFQYDRNLIEIIKSIPGRIYVPDKHIWKIPTDKLGFLQQRLTDFSNAAGVNVDIQIITNENINANQDFESTKAIPDVDISDITQYVESGSKLFDHQLDFLRYAKSKDTRGFLLADDCGLGKSLEIINLALYHKKKYGLQHCLIICCVNSAKFSWQDDIAKHTNGDYFGYILGIRKKRDGSFRYGGSAEKLEDLITDKMYSDKEQLPFFIIMNIEAIQYSVGRKKPIVDALIEKINSGYIGLIAIDEIHKNASAKSAQGKCLLHIKKKTEDKAQWIPMTGTPIVNRPTDCYVPLKLIGACNYESFYIFQKAFCIFGGYGDHEVMGYKNIPLLKSMLQNNMLRRMKEDVLDLPEKIHFTEYVENTPYQDKLYKQVLSGMIENKGKILFSSNPLSEFLRLRQVNGAPELIDETLSVDADYIKYNSKIKRVLELIEDIVERGEKVVIFSNWVCHLKTLYRFVVSKYKTACYIGTMDDAERDKHKRVFINNPEYKVLMGTVGALGTNHTLTVANNIIFLDEPWNQATKQQCEDRIYRIGAKVPANIYTIITKDTVDETVHKLIFTKDGVSKFIVDDKLDLKNHPELLDLLLGK